MDAVMDGSDHEDAKEHPMWREGWEKAADAGDQEEDSEDNCSGFEHRMFVG